MQLENTAEKEPKGMTIIMDNRKILSYIDHTQLSAVSSWDDIKRLCSEAIENSTASVCIPPSYIARVRSEFGESLKICTVIGFPLGYSTTSVKVYEAEEAIIDGADEIDMVINLGEVKNGNFTAVTEEIRALKEVAGDKILKVIIETCFLTEAEKIKLCECVTEAEADFIKTSTGFGTAGAKIEDIRLFRKHIGEDVKIKAAGGIKTKADLEMFINEGCSRIGTSSAVSILTLGQAKDY